MRRELDRTVLVLLFAPGGVVLAVTGDGHLIPVPWTQPAPTGPELN